jgi:hypothetical protein
VEHELTSDELNLSVGALRPVAAVSAAASTPVELALRPLGTVRALAVTSVDVAVRAPVVSASASKPVEVAVRPLVTRTAVAVRLDTSKPVLVAVSALGTVREFDVSAVDTKPLVPALKAAAVIPLELAVRKELTVKMVACRPVPDAVTPLGMRNELVTVNTLVRMPLLPAVAAPVVIASTEIPVLEAVMPPETVNDVADRAETATPELLAVMPLGTVATVASMPGPETVKPPL